MPYRLAKPISIGSPAVAVHPVIDANRPQLPWSQFPATLQFGSSKLPLTMEFALLTAAEPSRHATTRKTRTISFMKPTSAADLADDVPTQSSRCATCTLVHRHHTQWVTLTRRQATDPDWS